MTSPPRTPQQLVADLRGRADRLCGEKWEIAATKAMMHEAAGCIDEIESELREHEFDIAQYARVVAALRHLRQNANRLCDRCLGGTYEEDCRRSIALADAALAGEPKHA